MYLVIEGKVTKFETSSSIFVLEDLSAPYRDNLLQNHAHRHALFCSHA